MKGIFVDRLRSRTFKVKAMVVVAIMGVAGASFIATAGAAGAVYYVSPNGSDTNSGTSPTEPFKTIQKALDVAAPGTTINLAPGDYQQRLVTKVHGTAAAPITIQGPETGKDPAGRYKAKLYGPPATTRIFNIDHNYYTLKGFTIDGHKDVPLSQYPTDFAQVRTFKDGLNTQGKAIDNKLVYVGSADLSRDVTGTRIDDMFLNGAGGECVRLRNRTTNSVVTNSVIQWCGMFGKGAAGEFPYHNGEGVYIGTSPKSTTQPMYGNDASTGNVVSNSTIRTFGSECFNVKENAYANTLENSICQYNDEPASENGSNIELRGHRNTIKNTDINNSRSWNVKMWSDEPKYDLGGNSLQQNRFASSTGAAISNKQTSPGLMCGNVFAQTAIQDPNGISVGDPKKPCPTTPVVINIEAESGVVANPMLVQSSSTAQGGRFIVQTSYYGTGSARYTVNVPVSGNYVMKGRVTAPNSSSNAFNYSMDGATQRTWDIWPTSSNWNWVTGPTFNLSAGQHSFTVYKRDTNTRLDALSFTKQ